ncbi:MAG: flagellar motor switch protein FliG [Frankiales bacterium]|jgi:flagellar motor switch protein FliG|nr:flagellar motor switch protein FliG [Frankiales bacterium]
MTLATLSPVENSRRKAAIALVALGPERAAAVMRTLSESEIKLLAAEVATLGPVSSDEVRSAVNELVRSLGSTTLLPAPGKRFAKDLLLRALGEEKGALAAAELDVPAPFAWLADADPERTAEALAAEPPAAVALALAHVDSRVAAALLVRLPDDVRLKVATRIASLGAVHPDTLRHVEAGLKQRVADVLVSEVRRVSGPALLADVLAKAGKETSRELLQAVAQLDPELAEATRDAMFTFDDVCALEPRAMQVLLRSVDSKHLATSLATSPDPVRDRVLANLSERARETLMDEIEMLTGVRSKAVEEARAAVVASARRLEEEGALVLTRPGDDD